VWVSLAAAFVVVAGSQLSAPPDRARTEQLARSGPPAEAMQLLERIVEQDPEDVEARIWIARLQLRLGRTSEAEAGFRAIVGERPRDVDARIGLGAALTRNGAWSEALDVLHAAERDGGENSDLFGALGRAYRRAGDDRQALAYFQRAHALAPSDSDAIDGFEAVARAYGHSIAFEGYGERLTPDTHTASGTLTVDVRTTDRLHLDATARLQQRAGSSEVQAGGGAVWRAGRTTTLDVVAIGGPGNATLPTLDLAADVLHYAGSVDVGGGFRRLSFATADVSAGSATLAWDPGGRARLDARYTYSHSSFAATDQTSGDHSVLLRDTWRAWRRVDLTFAYAYGIERFEDLTADRLRLLGATTLAGGFRIRMRSLTMLTTTWEHQWRSNDTAIDRVTVAIAQSFR
jgi:tetratricopeptide (TPR) repeat protein